MLLLPPTHKGQGVCFNYCFGFVWFYFHLFRIFCATDVKQVAWSPAVEKVQRPDAELNI